MMIMSVPPNNNNRSPRWIGTYFVVIVLVSLCHDGSSFQPPVLSGVCSGPVARLSASATTAKGAADATKSSGQPSKPRQTYSTRIPWEERLEQLGKYKAIHGNCRVPFRYKENPSLGHWVNTQRRRLKAGKLSDERISDLETIGFEWDIPSNWTERLRQLEQYKVVHGHCRVPQKYQENPSLGHWVNKQRTSFKSGKLSDERISDLDAIGFDWDLSANWIEWLQQLEAYKAIHGHCRVPRTYKENPSLANWVSNQRHHQKVGKLSDERISDLEAIGFEWDLSDKWTERLRQLKEYKTIHGNCRVPQKYQENPSLGHWVSRQRHNFKSDKLSDERIADLTAIGFEWEVPCSWNDRLQQLEEYKVVHGHCRVPQHYKENPSLGIWVSNQRSSFKSDQLSDERIAQLNAIGFEWSILKTRSR